jgi:hypothetical protein
VTDLNRRGFLIGAGALAAVLTAPPGVVAAAKAIEVQAAPDERLLFMVSDISISSRDARVVACRTGDQPGIVRRIDLAEIADLVIRMEVRQLRSFALPHPISMHGMQWIEFNCAPHLALTLSPLSVIEPVMPIAPDAKVGFRVETIER